MKIKKIELNNFKRFTHLSVEDIPETTKLVILVGPNGSGKTSFMEAMNHYYKCAGYNDAGDYHYLSKAGNVEEFNYSEWRSRALKLVNIDFHEATFSNTLGNHDDIKGHFYFRSAYRNEPDFQIESMQKQQDPTKSIRLSSLIQNDQTVSANYQRLIANTIAGVFDNANDTKAVATLRDELIGKIQVALKRVFEDLELSSVGDPLQNGNFYFTKGTTKDFSYRNLSAGEKSAFDLILDMVVQSKYYPDAIYCIDEPETHMHTKLQGRVLRELYLLIPGQSQLWLSTHSIGMLQEAEEIEKEHPGTVAFLDFGGRDFDTDQVIRPARIGKAVMDKFYELAFGDFAKLMLPKTIVFCEGDPIWNWLRGKIMRRRSMHWASCSSRMIQNCKILRKGATGWNGQCRTVATMPPTGWARNISTGRTHRKNRNARRNMCAWLPSRAIPTRSTCWENSISAATACRRTGTLPTTGSRKRRRRDTTMQDFSWTASSGRSRRTFCSRQRGCSITWERSFRAARLRRKTPAFRSTASGSPSCAGCAWPPDTRRTITSRSRRAAPCRWAGKRGSKPAPP